MDANIQRDPKTQKVTNVVVGRTKFDTLLGNLIATPAEAKEGIKPTKPKASKGKAPKSPRHQDSK